MNSRERLIETIHHRQPDRLCVDFGAGGQTGMGAGAVYRLRKAVLGEDPEFRVKIIEPFQMLGEIDEPLRQALDLDVVGVNPRTNMFGFADTGWKPFEMFDGTPVWVPENFNYTYDKNGGVLMYPEGDVNVAPSAVMPEGGYFFDALNRQGAIDESRLDPADNCQEFGILSDEDLQHFKALALDYHTNSDYGVYMTLPGAAFGDIALVPATWAKSPKGIRDVAEWYMSTSSRRDYVYEVFDRQCEIALKNIELLAETVGERVQVVFVSGTDFGCQTGLMVSPNSYRDLYKPFQKKVNDKIHELTDWKIFIHSCGGVYDIIPDIIEAGFDILNPVQCSAEGMGAERLKREFGDDIVFWGGGVDTQKTLPFGTPEEVYKEVCGRIEVFARGGGFVFNSIHNVQSDVPVENMLAMFNAIKDCR
ncbi:MAG: methyltransferase [Phycisphaerae bacterium]|nr:methyltransferase [Phycisphaerae bacterium]